MRILIVEDEKELAARIAQALAREDVEAVVAHDGAEGLDLAICKGFDAIVLDLMLPRVSGRNFLRQLREECDAPVIILTALTDIANRVACLDEGADDYLTKPFEMSELLARIRAAVRRAGGRAKDAVEVGDLTIHLARREVSVDGKRVELTIQEYRILEALVLARGNPVNRIALWHRIAGFATDETSNVVSVYIHRLRSKLGNERIETRYGYGYAIAS